MNNLPWIVAGPILRRTTENRVCVWLALSEQVNIQLKILDQNEDLLGISQASPSQLQKLGRHLYVALLEARPLEEVKIFPKDQLLYYQITEADEDKPSSHPFDLGDCRLPGCPFPSFYIPSRLTKIVHGSCRKPHGKALDDTGTEFHLDAFPEVDKTLEAHVDNLEQRPAILCLTGDQIYADDVPDSLLGPINELSQRLMESDQGVPGFEHPGFETGKRWEKLKKAKSGLSTCSGSNHLIGFGEFAAAYLVAFGNLVSLKPSRHDESVRAYLESSKAVRRALANIQVYTVFDDHEVSDDWNISGEWYNRVRFNRTGRRIVSNALAAYWAFQGWGNNPDHFDEEFKQVIREHLAEPHSDDKGELFDLMMWKHRHWSYTVPTSPPIIALDTRTQRYYDSSDSPARLMDRYSLDELRINWWRLKNQGVKGAPIFLSATPVFGFDPAEKGQSLLSGLRINPEMLDAEAWILNKKGYSAFLDTLLLRLGITHATFLSGDVHYSYVNKGTYRSGGKTLTGYQLTSSAMKNSPGSGKYLDWLRRAFGETEHHHGLRSLVHIPFYRKPWLQFTRNDAKYPVWNLTIRQVEDKSGYRCVTCIPNVAVIHINHLKVTKQELITPIPDIPPLVFNIEDSGQEGRETGHQNQVVSVNPNPAA
ncbi:hypothetical protein [Hahella ganghwensis]|uniref:hypothetical protein n=1 Tax=Hahella ganghwensis TaxID=286420 RepID=UPI0003771E04|nr:hypothetical protein [Hahella ganghwensis]